MNQIPSVEEMLLAAFAGFAPAAGGGWRMLGGDESPEVRRERAATAAARLATYQKEINEAFAAQVDAAVALDRAKEADRAARARLAQANAALEAAAEAHDRAGDIA